ncbi:rhombotarget A [Acinetobacter gerneri]|uniref:rhombotarget A n=1 Tax=Acinetobacter gerneri TaxID=202952 RepID=UPI0028AF4073|nr:rhombotarget A [Acinetobacter gerneri]
MLKQGIVLGLLCIAGHAYSGAIVVKTTEDNDSETSQCSLRHAIEYVNQGMPEAGYKGCGGKDATNVIQLTGNQTYKLNKQILITKAVTINTIYDANTTPSTEVIPGQNNAVIQMVGKDRLFTIDRKGIDPTVPVVSKDATESDTSTPSDGSTTDAAISVQFSEVSFQGCGQAQCADKGGLFLNRDQLIIKYGKLEKGYAVQGGAIYNEGLYDEKKPLSLVSLQNVLAQNNTAQQGAVIYTQIAQYVVNLSVIRDNTVTDNNSAVFDVEVPFDEATSKALTTSSATTSAYSRGIWNTTIFKNTGHVAKVFDSMLVNNITMIGNSAGLMINAPFNYSYVANSILVQNGSADCEVQSADFKADQLANNLYSVGCAGTKGEAIGSAKLFAGSSIEGECDVTSEGMLCPFANYSSTTWGYFRPRLSLSYKSIADSPIVNKGPPPKASGLMQCEATDQRGKKRPDDQQLCDRGAVELAVSTDKAPTMGEDLLYGETATMKLPDILSDGDLLMPEQCQSLLGDNPTGKAWEPGCAKITQRNATPSKGTTTISQDGTVKYVPNGNWHGSDEFDLQVITTTMRFNDSKSPYITISVNIVQAPPNTFENKSVKTSGGSVGIGALSILFGLIVLRRYKAKR